LRSSREFTSSPFFAYSGDSISMISGAISSGAGRL
jgi:hypothetical protein